MWPRSKLAEPRSQPTEGPERPDAFLATEGTYSVSGPEPSARPDPRDGPSAQSTSLRGDVLDPSAPHPARCAVHVAHGSRWEALPAGSAERLRVELQEHLAYHG